MLENYLIAAAYVSFRIAPITLVSPIFVFSYIPVLVRVLLTVVWAVVVAFSLDAHLLEAIPTTLEVRFILCELFLGLLLSLGFHAANAALHSIGQLLDTQIGFSAAALFDPMSAQETGPVGGIFSLVLGATFCFTDIYDKILFGLSRLLQWVPPGTFIKIDLNFFSVISEMFVIGFVLASPCIIGVWLIDVALSIISRSMPQVQIYFVAMPLKILLGLYLLGVSISFSSTAFYELGVHALNSWELLVKP